MGFSKGHLVCSSRSPSKLPALSHKSMLGLLSTLYNEGVSNYLVKLFRDNCGGGSREDHETVRYRKREFPQTLTMLLMAPNRSFTHCRYSVKHKKDPDSNKAFSIEDGRKCIYMKNRHKSEST
jgi:hypothetical protein